MLASGTASFPCAWESWASARPRSERWQIRTGCTEISGLDEAHPVVAFAEPLQDRLHRAPALLGQLAHQREDLGMGDHQLLEALARHAQQDCVAFRGLGGAGR